MAFFIFQNMFRQGFFRLQLKVQRKGISEKLMFFFTYLHFNSLLVLHLLLATTEKCSLNWNNLKKRITVTVLL